MWILFVGMKLTKVEIITFMLKWLANSIAEVKRIPCEIFPRAFEGEAES